MTLRTFFNRNLFLAYFDNIITLLKKRFQKNVNNVRIYQGFNYLNLTEVKKNALILYLPQELIRAINSKEIKKFNQTGISFEISKALNELGFIVDMIDYRHYDYKLLSKYDLFIGQSCGNFEKIANFLQEGTKKITFATTSYWKYFNKQSFERYDNFSLRKQPSTILNFSRPIDDEEYCSTQSDLIICLGKYTASTFPKTSKVIPINNASYFDSGYSIEERNFEKGRNGFIYFAGSGNVQKGLDLLLEAFSLTPHLHLYLHVPLEKDIISYYKNELSQKNIHYIYHYRKYPSKLRSIINKCNFTIYAGFNSGQTTALIGSLSYGLIPVINKESNIDVNENGFLIHSNSVECISETLLLAASKSTDWYKNASINVQKYFFKNHTPNVFKSNFKNAVQSILEK